MFLGASLARPLGFMLRGFAALAKVALLRFFTLRRLVDLIGSFGMIFLRNYCLHYITLRPKQAAGVACSNHCFEGDIMML